jgi:hypothetical protein
LVNKLTERKIFYYSSRKRQNGKMGTHEKPTVEVIPSKEEIYKNMALILVDGKTEEAKRRLKRLELKPRRYFTDIDSSKFIFANEGL